MARVKSVLRRTSEISEENAKKHFGSLEIDIEAYIVRVKGKVVVITQRDLSLLLFLSEHPNKSFTRDQLIEHVWGWDYVVAIERLI